MPTLHQLGRLTRTLDVACARCPRRGRLSLARLIREHGSETMLREATADLNADCPNREAWRIQDRCDVYFPELPRLLGVPEGELAERGHREPGLFGEGRVLEF